MPGRDNRLEVVALVADTENSFAFPAGTTYFELNARNNNTFVFSFQQGETAVGDARKHRTVRANADWYVQPKMKAPDDFTVYLRCSVNEIIEIVHLVE